MLVKVTQEHIDKARQLIPNAEFICMSCPIALALKDTFKVEIVWASHIRLSVGQFPENLVFEVPTPLEITKWMDKFDSDQLVEPFEFELSLEGVKI